jgi:16S rRNA (guanine966-N2)-methyltransferase
MPRIVAGVAKGRRLSGPAAGTRPTSDRAREALFNSLGSLLDLDGARVLDLFAGTGAVGLEALSRGAIEAVFVESDAGAAQVLRRNIDVVGLPGARIIRRPVAPVVATPSATAFDLVFADPPYEFDDAGLGAVLVEIEANGWLADEAVLVVERAARGAPPAWPEGVEGLRDRRYGAGVLWYGRRR